VVLGCGGLGGPGLYNLLAGPGLCWLEWSWAVVAWAFLGRDGLWWSWTVGGFCLLLVVDHKCGGPELWWSCLSVLLDCGCRVCLWSSALVAVPVPGSSGWPHPIVLGRSAAFPFPICFTSATALRPAVPNTVLRLSCSAHAAGDASGFGPAVPLVPLCVHIRPARSWPAAMSRVILVILGRPNRA